MPLVACLRIVMVTFLIQAELQHRLLQEVLALLCLADRCSHK